MTAKIIDQILCDEAFSQKTFIITTNNPNLLQRADKVVFLKKGKMEFVGSPKDFFGKYEVNQQQEQGISNLDSIPEKPIVSITAI